MKCSLFQANAWESISKHYNSQSTVPRSGEQLRQKFDSLKKESRKYAGKKRQLMLQTGGGPSTHKINEALERVLGIINITAEGYAGNFDSDSFQLRNGNLETRAEVSLV